MHTSHTRLREVIQSYNIYKSKFVEGSIKEKSKFVEGIIGPNTHPPPPKKNPNGKGQVNST